MHVTDNGCNNLMSFLNISESDLVASGAIHTAREIQQQPVSWSKTQQVLDENATAISNFLTPIIAQKDLRIILTGAGTSAFIGECLQPVMGQKLQRRVEAIATTDLVSGSAEYLQRDLPTLLVSFGRSGDSPESVAAVELVKQTVDTCYQLIITCNSGGELMKLCEQQQNCFALLLPEETNDRGFAMTSSFTSMMYAALAMLTGTEQMGAVTEQISASGVGIIRGQNDTLRALADKKFQRVVFLGSNGLKGLAREASLKLLELSDGETPAIFDSPLGFRHGPKSIVDGHTLVFIFISNDSHTRKYDLDLLTELRLDAVAGQVIAITARLDSVVSDGDYLLVDGLEDAKDALLLFPYIVIAQLYAFHHSLALGNTPDTPSASGTVNRVVKGVTIYPLACSK